MGERNEKIEVKLCKDVMSSNQDSTKREVIIGQGSILVKNYIEFGWRKVQADLILDTFPKNP